MDKRLQDVAIYQEEDFPGEQFFSIRNFSASLEANSRMLHLFARLLETQGDIKKLTKEEKNEMLNLAGKKRKAVAPDLPEYIMQRDYVSAALRTARDLDAGEEEWKHFVEELKKRKG